MNEKLQGKFFTLFMQTPMSSFRGIIMHWLEWVERYDCTRILIHPYCKKMFLNKNNTYYQEQIHKNIQGQLEALKKSFEHYFKTTQEKTLNDLKWVLNVFMVNRKPPSLFWAIQVLQWFVISLLITLLDHLAHRSKKSEFKSEVSTREFQSFYMFEKA